MNIELSDEDRRLLREAASEFIAAREPVKGYVARRYAGASYEERDRHVTRVTQRVERMTYILETVLETPSLLIEISKTMQRLLKEKDQ